MVREFSKPDPRAKMKIVTKIERVQPTMAGVDEHGDIIWEGRAMPDWQMKMFRIFKDWEDWFYTQWGELWNYEAVGRDFNDDDSKLPYKTHGKSKDAIEARKRMYSKNKYWNHVKGD